MKHILSIILHIRVLFLICIALIISTHVKAEKVEPTFTFNLRNANLEDLVRSIESTSDYTFIYGEEIHLKQKINLSVNKKTLNEVLTLAFSNEPINFQLKGKHILLSVKKNEQKPAGRKYTISGYVTDGVSSETVIGANIFENYRQQGTTTNPYGFYSITLPEGEVSLKFSYLGYEGEAYRFSLHADTLLNIQMQSNNLLQEVVVLSDKTETGNVATHMGANEIPIAQIKHTPSILGEADVMKTIQLMPGVQAGIDGSAGLYVRGGGPDQNLVLLDGVPVYNVDHLFGFFSVFTPEAVKKVTLFKSSFPARFGGRLSSVIDVRTNDGDMNKYHGVISIGLLTSKINIEGPIIKNKTSFNISARRSYIDLLAKPFMPKDDKIGYYFYDINAKINHKFSDRSRLFLSLYNGKDHFSERIKDDEFARDYEYYNYGKMSWGNTLVSTRWNYIFNNRLFSNTTISYNKYKFNVESYTQDQHTINEEKKISRYSTDYRSGIQDLSYQIDFDYNPNPNNHIKFGTQYTYHSFRPEVMTSRVTNRTDDVTNSDTLYNNMANSRIYAHEISAYAEDNLKIGSQFRVNFGLHFSIFHVQKKSYFSAQPRISARYQLNSKVALKASYTQMSQYIHLLASAPMAMPTDLWVPVTKEIKPMKSHQYSLGGYYTGIPGWEFSVESYFKDMRNVLEYKDGFSFIGSSSGWEENVEMGHGRSMGIEFMAQKTIGKTTGWVSYTLAKSDRKFSAGGINNGERFPYKYDRRHSVNLTLNHQFSSRIDIGASWVFYTGGTTTIPEESTTVIYPTGSWYNFYNNYYHDNGNLPGLGEVPYIEHRNNYRMPATHRLNIGINFNKKTKHGMRTWNISFYNVYNAMNPTFVYKSSKKDEQQQLKTVIKKYTLLPLIPSFTYTYKF